jgi:hypothetical protein
MHKAQADALYGFFLLRECPYSPQWSSWGLQSSSGIGILHSKHMMPANGQNQKLRHTKEEEATREQQ